MIRVPKGVKALYYEKSRVGKHIKRSKKKHTWKFALDDVEHTVELYVSKLSSKRKILVDGDIRTSMKSTSRALFSYPFKLGRHMLMVVQQETMWDLRIDSVSFQQLYALQKPSSSYEADDWGNNQADAFKTASSGWSQRPQEFEEAEAPQSKPWGEQDDYESFRPGLQAQQGLSEWEVYARPDPKNKSHAWDSHEEEPRFPEHSSPRYSDFRQKEPSPQFKDRRTHSPAYRDDYEAEYRKSPKQESRAYESLRSEKPRSSTTYSPPPPKEEPKPKPQPPKQQPPIDLFDAPPTSSQLPSDLFAPPRKEAAPQLSYPDVFSTQSPTANQGPPPQQFQQWQTAQPMPQQWPGGQMQPNPMMMNPMAMMMNPYYTAMMTGQMMKPGVNPNQRPF